MEEKVVDISGAVTRERDCAERDGYGENESSLAAKFSMREYSVTASSF